MALWARLGLTFSYINSPWNILDQGWHGPLLYTEHFFLVKRIKRKTYQYNHSCF
jgi:hypothetical protein